MELIDNRWCLASDIHRAQRFMEITGRQELAGLLSTKLGFDKSNVACFRCKQNVHFKRGCVNQEVADHGNPFHDDYYKKEIYHKTVEHTSGESLKRITGGSPKEKSQALVWVHDHAKHRIIHNDEGFNLGDYITDDGSAFVAEVKERTKEEILQEKTYRERCFVDYRIEEMQKVYEEARSYGRWDKKRESYVNHKGDPVVHPSQVVYNDVLAVIPLSGEYYSNIEIDKDYLKKAG
ncbi:putative transcription factor interactor and regulator CCHC(Zn) family [Helianthus annuus]|nr:putative transcription factor interactor and regulator CCHC(Zn) family [Helianthus annuus]KAJ0777051.1 putative transcription factor interactor and regulator CCHC(Zn) family [Helianthus annuus]KAJ0939698.1 putative transcription factor interactor and regulator CCHC(Zn) family [Helianthus annuus]